MSPKTLKEKAALQTATVDIDQIAIRHSDRLGGALCFVGTRVMVSTLFNYVRADQTEGLEEFLGDFPTVNRSQAEAVLQFKREDLNI